MNDLGYQLPVVNRIIFLTLVIIGSYFLNKIVDAILDHLQPKRLERFSLQSYRKGVRDSSKDYPSTG